MYNPIFAFAIALITSIGLTPAAAQIALRLDIIDHPGPRKVHRRAVPLLGSLAIYTGAVLAFLLFIDGSSRNQVIVILAGASLLFIVGILDDRGLLHHQVKLMVAMPLAGLILIASGIHFTIFASSAMYLGSSFLAFFLDYIITLLWVVGITAAFSILDHMDGLCAGVAAVAAAFVLLFAGISGQILVGILAASIFGASLGFLTWNFSPAKIFMGDGGAMFLGFMMATLGLKLRFPELPQVINLMIPILILGVPIFDTTLVTISRMRRGLVPFASPGKDHTAHRLANLGLGHRDSVLVLYMLGILFGMLALLLTWFSVWQTYILASVMFALAFLVICILEKAPYERQ